LVLDFNNAETHVRPIQQERRRRKSDTVYEDMKRQILVGDMTADSIITEQSLAQTYDCSQSTIREALLTLQEDGLVIRRGYQGTFVTHTTNEEATILLRLRMNIECGALGHAIDNMTPADLALLQQLAQDYDTARSKRSIIDVSIADTAFHITLLRIAGMPILEPVLLRTILHLHRFVITRHKHKMVWVDEIEASHQVLLEAIKDGDKEAANRILIAHNTTNSFEVAEEIQTEVLSKFFVDDPRPGQDFSARA